MPSQSDNVAKEQCSKRAKIKIQDLGKYIQHGKSSFAQLLNEFKKKEVDRAQKLSI